MEAQKRISEMVRVLDTLAKAYKYKGTSNGAEIEIQYKEKANEYNKEVDNKFGSYGTPYFTSRVELYVRLREFDGWDK